MIKKDHQITKQNRPKENQTILLRKSSLFKKLKG